MADKLKVEDYMTQDVITVSPEDTIAEVIDLIHKTDHDGFPVVKNGKVEGYIASMDLLSSDQADQVSKVMSKDLVVAHPDMYLTDAARVMFRKGVSKLMVVNDDGYLEGILSNADVIRSQIERADPQKVWKLKKTLEIIHDIKVSVKHDKVLIDQLVPTQPKIHLDELEGRIYELKRGLTEPIVVIKKPNKMLLVDGHHRVIAAKRLGIDAMDAYIIVMEKNVPLGMERTAKDAGLLSLDDVKILNY
ncbi:MAG: CBS domain-containing protein [Methanocellales archaeon]|nr:CBS domain-containing protein [Methanocellales archaeon]MDD3292228.1 CBS domain-containing protein [Methanocellales archaeon]MDD5234786.1 CBS domain-containing protein [Methanocellales archaeon]MDD5484844.1 CBS domain-containing protein [Methanocellales archaeon]